jgi:hypothetical protein
MFKEVSCKCGGELVVDFDETKKDGISIIYRCEKCDRLFILQMIGQKPRGWRTKKMLEEKNFIKDIPF